MSAPAPTDQQINTQVDMSAGSAKNNTTPLSSLSKAHCGWCAKHYNALGEDESSNVCDMCSKEVTALDSGQVMRSGLTCKICILCYERLAPFLKPWTTIRTPMTPEYAALWEIQLTRRLIKLTKQIHDTNVPELRETLGQQFDHLTMLRAHVEIVKRDAIAAFRKEVLAAPSQ